MSGYIVVADHSRQAALAVFCRDAQVEQVARHVEQQRGSLGEAWLTGDGVVWQQKSAVRWDAPRVELGERVLREMYATTRRRLHLANGASP